MVVEVVTACRPTPISSKAFVTGDIPRNYSLVTVHAQVGLQVNAPPEHVNVFFVASRTSENI
jgi:hypothetical protein